MLLLTESAETSTEDVARGPRPSERRRGLRVRQQRHVKIYAPAASRYFGGQTVDVSATGLRVELPAYAPVREGDTLCVHIGLSRQGQPLANRKQMVPVRVVWISRSGPHRPGVLEAGVEFVTAIAARLDAA